VADVTPSSLIVVRAWRDADGFKVRLLHSDRDGRSHGAVAASVTDACRVVACWLAALEEAQTDGRMQT
jgi:hypothetical protein